MRLLRSLGSEYLKNKTCLLRVNLDIEHPVRDNWRLEAIMPTIKYLLDNGAKVLLLSHRGRPNGTKDPNLSLEPLVRIIFDKLNLSFDAARDGSLSWLENLRFLPWEENNDEQFAKELAAKGDFYVNDDFATSHRRHASIVALAEQLPSFAGFLLEKEIEMLSKVRDNPDHPLVVIIGGIKIEDKAGVIDNLKNQANNFLMGSAYLNAEASEKFPVLKSKKVELPIDVIEDGGMKLDVGEETIERYQKIISSAKTVIWSGPVGKFEDSRYLNGSRQIAEAIINSGAFSVVGGGDTIKLISQLGLMGKFNFVSTGGGAMLAFLAGKEMPGVEVLTD